MKTHPNVPKLIEYSIDKMLVVLYDLKAKCPLHHIICEDVALCTRVSMAAKIGHILQSFHDKGIGIGCIESHSILLDQEDNIYTFVTSD
ncbi:hypothetical protein Leryth_016779 [Lithospermum erythrorhizon]|nr:hypothetical protein Leryth_016779 [Lithospermum erythrorhizon]